MRTTRNTGAVLVAVLVLASGYGCQREMRGDGEAPPAGESADIVGSAVAYRIVSADPERQRLVLAPLDREAPVGPDGSPIEPKVENLEIERQSGGRLVLSYGALSGFVWDEPDEVDAARPAPGGELFREGQLVRLWFDEGGNIARAEF